MKRGHGYHIIFGLTLLALVALGAWWTVYIGRSLEVERRMDLAELRYASLLKALALGRTRSAAAPGELPGEPRLELVPSEECSPADLCAAAEPLHPELSVGPTSRAMAALKRKIRRRRVMIIGEGSLLFLLLGVCTAMLYRLVRQERRHVARMEDFVSAVTHEMKTPLTGMKSLLQTLAAGKVPEEQQPGLFAMGLKQAERLQRSIENILISGSLRTDRYLLRLEPLDLLSELEGFIEQRRGCLVERPDAILLCWDIEEKGTRVQADAEALRTILDNLADNAFKYGGPEPRVSIRASRQGGRILVSIQDEGMGFEPQEAERLFLPFHRGLDPKGKAPRGTGLGLSIARSLATRMQGDLQAHSEGRGRGSRFTLTLRKA